MSWNLFRCRWLVLLLLAVGLLSPKAIGANPSDTIYVTSEQPFWESGAKEDGTIITPDLTYREVIRQALMLSAREQFRLKTRDATLREPMPTDSDTPGLIDVKIKTVSGKRIYYELLLQGKQLMKGELKYHFAGDRSGLAILVDRVYPWAMEEFAEVLEKEGYERTPRPEGAYDEVAIPEEIEAKLLAMDVLSQYMAVRMAHAAIEEEGETLGMLAALTRGYGNLSQLTEYYPSHLRLAFDARALLYGTRMIKLRPESPYGYWNRGYYFMLSGRSWDAKLDFEKAERLAGDEPHPDWLPMLELAFEYDYHGLAAKAARKGSQQELAAFLWYRSIEFSDSQYLNMTVGKKCVELLPRCTRITNGMNRVAGVSYGHRTTTIGFQQFAALLKSDLPKLMAEDDAIQGALDQIEEPLHGFSGMIAARESLLEASTNDASPMSLAVLARIIDEEVVTMIIYRTSFLRDSLGTDATGFLDATRPFYEGHPHAPLIETFRYPSRTSVARFQKELANYEATEGNVFTVRHKMVSRIPKEVNFRNMTAGVFRSWLYLNCTPREPEYLYIISFQHDRESYSNYAQWLGGMHPHSPFRARLYVLHDWEKTKEKPEWIEEHGRHPAVAGALAKKYAEDGEYEEAEKWYLAYIKESPEYNAYLQLAALYWNHLDGEEEAVKIVEEYLTKEDFGLGHSNLSREVAYSLMSRGKDKEALPWAQRAADSYSGQGLRALAHCKERLGDLDSARELYDAIDERYNSVSAYGFVARTGHGDLEEALKTKRATERNHPATTKFTRLSSQAYHFLYTEEVEKAHDKFLQIDQLDEVDNNIYLVHAAALADTMGNKKVRDELWKRVTQVSAEISAKGSNNDNMRRLSQLFLDASEGALPSFEQVNEIQPQNKFSHYPENHYFAGRFCEARGEKKRAIQHYAEAAKTTFHTRGVVIDPWRRLRALGEDPSELQPYWKGLAKFEVIKASGR